MNDDDPPAASASASSPSAPPPPIYDDDFRAHQQPNRQAPASLTPTQITARRKQNRQNFNKRRAHLLDDLVRGLDVLVYAELGVGYFMDCSTPILIIRCLLQFLYLTPKDEIFPTPPSGSRVLGIVLAVNILCGVLHFWRGGPVGSVLDRGYLHGGLVLDFIGQKGGMSRWTLLGLDLVILVLQVVCCAVVRVRAKVEDAFDAVKAEEEIRRDDAPRPTRQGVEDEERGVRRSEEVGREGDVEMERLNPDGRRADDTTAEDEERGRSILASTTAALERTDAHIFDAFNSGQIVLADLDLGRMVHDEWNRKGEDEESEVDAVIARRNREIRQRLVNRVRGRVGLGNLARPAAQTGGEV